MRCTCPRSASLPYFKNNNDCYAPSGQIKRLAFSKAFAGDWGRPIGFTDNTPGAGITHISSWYSRTVDTSDDQIVITPIVQGLSFDGGDPVSYGGGNATYGGIEYVVAGSPINVSCEFINKTTDVRAALRKMECFNENLRVYFITGYDKVASSYARYNDGGASGTYKLIHAGTIIHKFVVSDFVFGMFDKPDSFRISFQLEYGWSDDLDIVQVDGPMDELVNRYTSS